MFQPTLVVVGAAPKYMQFGCGVRSNHQRKRFQQILVTFPRTHLSNDADPQTMWSHGSPPTARNRVLETIVNHANFIRRNSNGRQGPGRRMRNRNKTLQMARERTKHAPVLRLVRYEFMEPKQIALRF